jgi:hypothetical protein
MKHLYVALRFLPRESNEAVAPTEVMPRPHVVTGIFMVARGLDDEEAEREGWGEASLRASQPKQVDVRYLGSVRCSPLHLVETIFEVEASDQRSGAANPISWSKLKVEIKDSSWLPNGMALEF